MNDTFDSILNNASSLFGKYLESRRPVSNAPTSTGATTATNSGLPSWLLPVAAIGGLVLVLVLVLRK